jgi:phospho-N-acetylmuramoyl-pentapeptide-transferase
VVALLLAAGSAMLVSLFGTRFLISWLRTRGIGQPIHEDVPEGHTVKAGTPPMGGLAIVVGAVIGYVVAHFRARTFYTNSGLLLMALIVGAGLVGLLDDWIKVTRERNLGLSKRAKMGGLLVVAITFAVLAVWRTPVHTTLSFTRFDSFDIDLGNALWILFGVLLIAAMTNAVNLTDGLDGLAAGSGSYAFIAYTVVAFWGSRHFDQYQLPHAFDLSVVAAAMLGACTGFLWWNAAPARIFMGDVGSLAMGAALAGLALMTSTALLLPVVGGVFVMETVSVILQVGSFKLTRGRSRIFRMAPIHHHFELAGWPETTIIVRFWILAGLCTALAVGIFYADFIAIGGID